MHVPYSNQCHANLRVIAIGERMVLLIFSIATIQITHYVGYCSQVHHNYSEIIFYQGQIEGVCLGVVFF